ncbi:MAG: tRNA(Ile)-lysidine synthase [Blastocatellia bacterium]|nr:tRNA(Ile)-lysidine synthase [Blastocatellia bacterium]
MRTSASDFSRSLLHEWRRWSLPVKGRAVLIGVSGGADSVALLLAADQLQRAGYINTDIVAAHLDHGLRVESANDAAWVISLSKSLGRVLVSDRIDVGVLADSTRDNVEQAARRARYSFFERAALSIGASHVLTGHTLDDQAETVLMRLIRGSGVDGLAGMPVLRSLQKNSTVMLARPLLNWARRDKTEEFCSELGYSFLRDSMNDDEGYSRVKVRKRIFPLLKELNPKYAENISRAALLCREDSCSLSEQASKLLEAAKDEGHSATCSHDDLPNNGTGNPALRVSVLVNAPRGLRRRALRLWLSQVKGDLRRIDSIHILAVEKLLSPGRGGRIAELPGGGTVETRKDRLIFKKPAESSKMPTKAE